jgi:hypothetical protein
MDGLCQGCPSSDRSPTACYAHRPASALVMRQRLRRLLPIGYVELTEIPRNALLKLCPAPLHLSACEVPIAVVHRFKFTAVNERARAWSDRSPLAPPCNFKR